jgi:hypothetical protein
MLKAKTVSLHPLSFGQAIDMLVKAKPQPQKKRALSKSNKRKDSTH